MELEDRTDSYVLWVYRDCCWWLVGWGKKQRALDYAASYLAGEKWEITQGITGHG